MKRPRPKPLFYVLTLAACGFFWFQSQQTISPENEEEIVDELQKTSNHNEALLEAQGADDQKQPQNTGLPHETSNAINKLPLQNLKPAANPHGGKSQKDNIESDKTPTPTDKKLKALTLPANTISEQKEYKQNIVASIGQSMPEIQNCYKEALAINPEFTGTINLQLKTTSKENRGVVSEASIREDSTTRSPFFESCIMNRLAEIEYPDPPEGEDNIVVPMVFEALPKNKTHEEAMKEIIEKEKAKGKKIIEN
jgi:hypothetical protein